MNKENIVKLKKYLFFISIFFSFIIGGHILYVYLYDNSNESPIKGGSVSEGIIGDFPNLNPLLNNVDYNKNIIYMLYSSLMRYDFEKNKIVSDLAECNIKDLSKVDCYLKDGVKWSNGEKITSKDVVSTLNLLKNSDLNPFMASILKTTTIQDNNGVIIFTNSIKDVNFLNVLLQPIVPSNVIENSGNKELYGKFNPMNGVFSGPYKIENVSYDDSLGIQKLILTENTNYKNGQIYITKYIYKFFKDSTHFLKHKDTVNIFYDSSRMIGDSIPRLDTKNFYLNQYVSIFINEDNIQNKDLRNFILNKVDRTAILEKLGNGYKPVYNPFLLEKQTIDTPVINSNLESLIKELGYYKKNNLSKEFINNTKQQVIEKQSKQQNPKLYIIVSPLTNKYSFIPKDDILLKGITNRKDIDEIYLNDYKLASYKKGSNEFFYRLKLSFKNINYGDNTYKIYYVIGGKKFLAEEFFVHFNDNLAKLEEAKTNFQSKIASNTTTKPTILTKQQQQQILSLDDKYYYNKNFKKLTFKIYYIDTQEEQKVIGNMIKNSLLTYGILVDLKPISISELNKKVLNNQKDYDMILVGIDLGYFDFNIFPYIHSSQSKNGYNFSNVKNLSVDILLEKLKTHFYQENEKLKTQKEILSLISQRHFLKTLYKKESVVLIDKNIKNFFLKSTIPSDFGINYFLNKSYVSSNKHIILEKKGIIDFFKFIKIIFTNESNTKE